jgi:hypothetical protein
MSELTGRHISSSKESLRSIKVDEGKCEDEISILFFKTKASIVTFATDATIPW